MRVGIKFCGNCNPHKDMPKLLRSLILLAAEIQFVRWQEQPFDVLLILCGCPVDCASRPEFDGPCVVVTSESVDRCLVSDDELPVRTIAALLKFQK